MKEQRSGGNPGISTQIFKLDDDMQDFLNKDNNDKADIAKLLIKDSNLEYKTIKIEGSLIYEG